MRPYPWTNVATESHLGLERKFLELSFPGAKVPGSESSLERKFLELSLLGAKVPGNESSTERKFHTMVLSLSGAKVLSESSIIPLNYCVNSSIWHFKFPKVVQAHTLGEVGILGTVLLRVSSGTILPIFVEICSYFTDREQKNKLAQFFWDTVYIWASTNQSIKPGIF